ncbi:MAG: RNA-dependent RNA polymerase [Sanya conocephalus maculatus rhabdovirus 1]|nr:MAG: RNA-dependent RNA polymerase [Sanya conocephalus maculatus rhabdovirus 1]
MEEISFSELLNLDSKASSKVPEPTHLDAPLRPVTHLWAKKERVRSGARHIREKSERFHQYLKSQYVSPSSILIVESLGPCLNSLMEDPSDMKDLSAQDKFSQCWRLMENLHLAQLKSLNLTFPESLNFTFQGLSGEVVTELRELFTLRHALEGLVLFTGSIHPASAADMAQYPEIKSANHVGSGYVCQLNKKLHLWATRDQVVVKRGLSVHVGDRSHLLMLSDVISQRFICLLSAHLAQLNGLSSYPSPNTLRQVFSWGDTILQQVGNQGYQYISSWESLCVAALLRSEEDPLVFNDRFYSNMRDDFLNVRAGLKASAMEWWAQVDSLLGGLAKSNPHHVLQVYGLYRLWGHPTIDVKAGIRKLRSTACLPRCPNWELISKVESVFKESFCLEYRRRHNKWPDLDTTRLLKNSYLRQCLDTNAPLHVQDSRYRLMQWGRVKFKKTFDIDPKFNLVELISDKAMSHGRSTLIDRASTGSIGTASERSVIYQWLQSKIGDPEEFLHDICKRGFGRGETVVGVCPKERELKLEPRLFGLLTLRKRMYVVLTEALLAEHLLPYFPEITMMNDSLTLVKKMFKTTSKAEHIDGVHSIFTSMDFQKWNSNMRKEETLGLFECFDDLFGLTHCYTRTHEMFDTSDLYLADGTFVPSFDPRGKMKPSPFNWDTHLGGIEGLRQKGWTIWTVCVLRLVMRDHDMKFQLMGQGDNQILKTTYHGQSANVVKVQHDKFLDSLENTLGQIGPPLKRSESWSSSHLFLYGKYPIWKGCPLSLSLKRLCRMFRLSNEGYPSLESAISSIGSNVRAACAQDFSPLLPYAIYLFEGIGCFQVAVSTKYLGNLSLGSSCLQRPEFSVPLESGKKKVTKLNLDQAQMTAVKIGQDSFMQGLILLPRCLGGYPTLLMGQLFYTGFPDPVTESLALFRLLKEANLQLTKLVDQLTSVSFSPSTSAEMLCEDPPALNLLHPSSPKELLRRHVQEFLGQSQWISNKEFGKFLELAEGRQQDLCKALTTMNKVNPRVMSDVVEATIIGRALQVVGQVNKTNTMIRLTAQQGQTRLDLLLWSGEVNYFNSVTYRLLRPQAESRKFECSSQQAQDWRNRSWKMDITGVTVASPWEAFCGISAESGACTKRHPNAMDGYVLAKPTLSCITPTVSQGRSVGSQSPYFGSHTEEKTKSYGKILARKTYPLLRSASRLLNLINWAVDPSSNLARCITTIFSSITDLNPELFIPVSHDIAGSLEHRLQDKATKHGGNISILYTAGSYLHISTNSLSKYSKGSANVNLHFQAVMSWISCWWSSYVYHSNEESPVPICIHYHIYCPSCITEVYEGLLEVKPHDWNALIPSFPNNPLCWVSSEKVEFLQTAGFKLKRPLSDSLCTRFAYSILSQFTAKQALEFTISHSSMSQGYVLDANIGHLLNVAQCYKTDPELFGVTFATMLASYIVLNYPINLTQITTRQEIMASLLNVLDHIPPAAFGWSVNLFLVQSFSDFMVAGPFPTRPPMSVPLTLGSCGSSIKAFVKNIWLMLPDWDTSSFSHHQWNTYETGPSSVHPIFLALTMSVLRGDRDTVECCQMINLFRSISRSSDPRVFLQADPVWLLKLGMKQSLDVRQGALVLHSLSRVVQHLKYRYITQHPDWIRTRVTEPDLYQSTPPVSSKMPRRLPCCVGDLLTASLSPTRESALIVLKPRVVSTATGKASKHQLKLVSSPTTAHYKLLSILNRIGAAPRRVACLGDGAGGFSLLFCRLYDVEACFYNTLIDSSVAAEQSLAGFQPPAFQGYPELRRKLVGVQHTLAGISDLTDRRYAHWLVKNLPDLNPDLITCDAEGGGWDSPEKGILLLQTSVLLGYQYKCPQLIVKTYLSNPSMVACQLSLALHFYKEVKVLRSYWSSEGNTEVYLWISHPRRASFPYQLLMYETPVLKGRMIEESDQLALRNLASSVDQVDKIPSKEDALIYTETLNMNWYYHSNILELRSLFREFSFREGVEFVFPHFYIMYHRMGVKPARFYKRLNPHTRITRLTDAKLAHLAKGWVAILLATTDLPVEQIRQSWTLYAYKTWTGSWSFVVTPCSCSFNLASTRAKTLSSLLSSRDDKALCHMSGLLKTYHQGAIKLVNQSLNYLPVSYRSVLKLPKEERGYTFGPDLLPKDEILLRSLFLHQGTIRAQSSNSKPCHPMTLRFEDYIQTPALQ